MRPALSRSARLLRRAALCGLAYFAVVFAAGVMAEAGSRERSGEEAIHAASEHVGALLTVAAGGPDGFDGFSALPATSVVWSSRLIRTPALLSARDETPRAPLLARPSARGPPTPA
jgi:hypothetical protein